MRRVCHPCFSLLCSPSPCLSWSLDHRSKSIECLGFISTLGESSSLLGPPPPPPSRLKTKELGSSGTEHSLLRSTLRNHQISIRGRQSRGDPPHPHLSRVTPCLPMSGLTLRFGSCLLGWKCELQILILVACFVSLTWEVTVLPFWLAGPQAHLEAACETSL